MTAPIFHWFGKSQKQGPVANKFGELALPFAPLLTLDSGERVVPQQYLDVVRTLENLETVLSHITVPEHFQLFAGQEGSSLYLIVAIVGKENYPVSGLPEDQDKIVYGRRWLIEDTTPTSEIVQTALLAIKKVREHELREKVSVTINQGANVTTPFNNHLDLPLLAGNAKCLSEQAINLSISEQCDCIRLDGLPISLKSQHRISDQHIVEVVVEGHSDHLHDLCNKNILVVFEEEHEFTHAFMQTLISMSDRTIDEALKFDACARFSWQFDAFSLAQFSYMSRNIKSHDERFNSAFKDMSYRVDAAKAPPISQHELGQQQRQFLASYSNLAGYLPLD